MPIIMISSASHSASEDLATSLGKKTGWPSLSRKELSDGAQGQGIKLGRLETSIIKEPVIREKLAREKDIYLAYVTASICERARDANLIYDGRAGHLLLPGVTHRLRIGLMAPKDARIKKAMGDLNISRDKARIYLDQLDEDYDKWVRYVHRVEWRDPAHYDFFINLQNMSLSNASAVLCSMAELPDFRPTPASLKLMEDIHLAARAKLRLASDERTRDADLGVRAVGGVVTVTYMPRQEGVAESILEVLRDLEGCKETLCTMAETNILWVQETFAPESDNFGQICQLAQRWGAAVELLRVAPHSEPGQAWPDLLPIGENPPAQGPGTETYTGGVEDDGPEMSEDDGGLTRTLEELVSIGRSAGGHTVYGAQNEVIERVKGNNNYSLVVLGDLFLDKGDETRMRQTREFALSIRERLKAPVITSDEMESRFLFGKRQAVRLLFSALLVVCIYFIIFSFQDPILNFLGGDIHEKWKWLASIGVTLFIPFIAYSYSTVTGLILKLIGVD